MTAHMQRFIPIITEKNKELASFAGLAYKVAMIALKYDLTPEELEIVHGVRIISTTYMGFLTSDNAPAEPLR